MKKTITIISLAILFCSCGSENDSRKKGITDYLNKNAKDPKSYEFVELKIIDTLTKSDFAEDKIKQISLENAEIEYKILELKQAISRNESSEHSSTFTEVIKGRKEIISSYENIINANNQDSIKSAKDLDNKDVIGYIASHKFRIKNGFGALDLDEMYVYFNKKDSVLSMEKENTPKTRYLIFKEAKSEKR